MSKFCAPRLCNQSLSNSSHQIKMDRRQGYCQDGTFPVKLHQMLEVVSDSDLSKYACWDRGGRSFSIADPKGFAKRILGNFFNQTKYKSFQRQLNFYGFHRTCRGKVRGIYSHPWFRRDKPEMCDLMKRLDSRDYKESVGVSSSNRSQSKSSSASSGLQQLPNEIIIAGPQDIMACCKPNNKTSVPSNKISSFYSMLFLQSTSCNAGIESIKTQSISLETMSDCDSSIGTIDMLPATYPSWELNENFGDDLFQST